MWRVACVGSILIATTLSLPACGSPTDGPAANAITSDAPVGANSRLLGPDEFASAVAEPGRLTINVHVPYEGDIAGTDMSIPFDQIAEQADRLPHNRSAKLAIYCRSGPMSATAAEALRSLGYTDVVELAGGMKAWTATGRPLVGI